MIDTSLPGNKRININYLSKTRALPILPDRKLSYIGDIFEINIQKLLARYKNFAISSRISGHNTICIVKKSKN